MGSSLIAQAVKILLAVLGNRLDLRTVMEAPPLLYNYLLSPLFVPEGAYGTDFLRNLELAGVRTEAKSKPQVLGIRGTAVVESVAPQTGVWPSVETPMRFDFASGY